MGSTVLMVVDDEEAIRSVLSRHFRLMGYEVEGAASVSAAEAVLERRRIDVVISDILMPDRLGTELLSTLRAHYPMTHAIMITGHVSLENAMACMRRGADTCVFKPLDDLSELDEAVQRALDDIGRWRRKLAQLKGLRAEERG